MEEQRLCSHCGCILEESEGIELDDDLLCDDCADEHTVTCDHCGERIWATDSICDDHTTLCTCCFDDHYRRCECCGRILHDDDVVWYNGVLYNDTTLRKQLNLPDTPIETDSYIAVQLIESQKQLTFDSLRYAAEKVRGYFTFTILDRQDNLYFIKGESPLYLIHFPSLGLYVYSSTREIMMAAFKQIPARFPQYEVIDVKEGELLRISPDGKITRDHYTVQPDYTIYSSRWFGSYLCGWDQPQKDCCGEDDYMLLLELCGYYGAEPETVQYLRELGYSYSEIEEFLMYPESYGAELALAEL